MDEYLPVYKILESQSSDKKMPMTKMDILSKKINILDENGHEIIFALILYYFFNINKYIPDDMPYGGTPDMVWKVSDLPDKLKWILFNFCEKHTSVTN